MKSQMYTVEDWEKASDATMYNKDVIQKSKYVACYHCIRVFEASHVHEFVDEDDTTALCPHCGIDALLGDATCLPIHDVHYLKSLYEMGFTKHPKTYIPEINNTIETFSVDYHK